MHPRNTALFLLTLLTSVSFSFSFAGCGGSEADLASSDAGDAGDAGDSAARVDSPASTEAGDAKADVPVCPANDNPAECPARYMEIPKGGACSTVGVTCKYYGEGDLPCPSYAICSCVAPSTDGGLDADAGPPTWGRCAQ